MTPEYERLLRDATEAVGVRHVAFHGGASLGERFGLVLASPQVVRIPSGTLLSVAISRMQALALAECLHKWAKSNSPRIAP